MATEIERKFLIKHDQLDIDSSSLRLEIKQSFLISQPGMSVRVRITSNPDGVNLLNQTPVTAQLCVKVGSGPERLEFEQYIPFAEALTLLEKYPMIHKMRHMYPISSTRKWEVDQFFGKLDGLWLAEIELDSLDEEIELPVWIGEEVTWKAEYYNCNLALK